MSLDYDLDKEIALKVMGWKVMSHWDADETIKRLHDENGCQVIPPEFKPYSTDIKTAWEVVKVFRGLKFSLRSRFEIILQLVISDRMDGEAREWDKNWMLDFREIIIWVEPIDICIAALRILGEENGGGETGVGRCVDA